MSDSVAIDYYGLRCNDEGDFYVCEGADNEFIGCCTSDPCADGGGICPDGDLRTATFDVDKFDQMKKQSCDDSRASTVWYTCQGLDPPFLGCCDVSPCSEGCTRENLLPAVLSSKSANRKAFLDPENVYSTTIVSSSTAASTRSATSSASASASASNSADSSDSGGLSHGAVAGIAAASAAVGVFLIMLLLWKCWWLPRHRKQNGQQFHPVGSHPHMHHHHHAGGLGEYDSHRSPTDYYQRQ
ncbi:hypothetical protein EDB81DRAFT_805092 [Dactylonectria macrodidyma]|uniref:Uncharacterized protein n=1 Tax=Dactylonectria macrodidyma TaxID=307937 RepID=A0A9P9IWP8_9HYPO|nr:hypothetical protein EDB81DRAFT_805092 [Dactylonectria macrodidyma]